MSGDFKPVRGSRRGRSDHRNLLASRARLAHQLYDDWLEESFCGCCGSPTAPDALWCDSCLAPGHLGPAHLRLHERTWFAVHHTPCPFTEDLP